MAFDLDTLLDIAKVGLGLAYLYYEYHAKATMWIISIIMPAVALWLFWNKGLYADFAINIYYLLMAVYGLIVWTRHGNNSNKKGGVDISNLPVRTACVLVIVLAAIWSFIAWVLIRYTDSTVPLLDSFTTSLSIVGTWMLARKYLQQWLVWFVVDAVYVWLYYKKGIYFSGTLYVFYTVMSIVGYRRWSHMMYSKNLSQVES